VVVEIDALGFAVASIPAKDEPPTIVDADRMRLESSPRSFSKWLLGGERRSWSVIASSII